MAMTGRTDWRKLAHMRNAILTDWLVRSEWSTWLRDPMTGDASARRYERLRGPSGNTVILMDAPPKICGSQSRFIDIAKHLTSLNLAAPQILNWDEELGILVLEDLGQSDFAIHMRSQPNSERDLYERAVDTLIALQSAPPPVGLTAMTPDVGTTMVDLAFEWAAIDQSADLQADIKSRIHALLARVDPTPGVLSLRDFHAENLVWRPDKIGLAQVGLLDFQDAFITHPTYDLASLLRDARRDVDPSFLDPLLQKMERSSGSIGPLKDAFHVMAVQRNLRILGIFQRLAHRDGKTGYLSLVPRVWAHLQSDLADPIFADLAPLIHRAFSRNKDNL